MSEVRARQNDGVLARASQPPIVLPVGDEDARYFTSEEDADAFVAREHSAEPINLAGVWSDLDWEEAEAALDRLRHESEPTPPIDSM